MFVLASRLRTMRCSETPDMTTARRTDNPQKRSVGSALSMLQLLCKYLAARLRDCCTEPRVEEQALEELIKQVLAPCCSVSLVLAFHTNLAGYNSAQEVPSSELLNRRTIYGVIDCICMQPTMLSIDTARAPQAPHGTASSAASAHTASAPAQPRRKTVFASGCRKRHDRLTGGGDIQHQSHSGAKAHDGRHALAAACSCAPEAKLTLSSAIPPSA